MVISDRPSGSIALAAQHGSFVESALFPDKAAADELLTVSEKSQPTFRFRFVRKELPSRSKSSPNCQSTATKTLTTMGHRVRSGTS